MIKRMLIAILLGYLISGTASASSVTYGLVKSGGIAAHVVTVNLADPEARVTVALARGGLGKGESFKSMVKRSRPVAAITGTFFDTKTMIPTGDIAVFGKVVHKGCVGSALCIDSRNKAVVVPLRKGRANGWDAYETVLCCGPSLISGGSISVSLKKEGFGRSLTAPATRTAVGITKNGKLLLVAVNRKTSFHAVARLMKSLGVVDALSLDGGSSTGFYANGRYMAAPARRLTNLLVVYKTFADYAYARDQLVRPATLDGPTAQPAVAKDVEPTLTQIAEARPAPSLIQHVPAALEQVSALDSPTLLPGVLSPSPER